MFGFAPKETVSKGKFDKVLAEVRGQDQIFGEQIDVLNGYIYQQFKKINFAIYDILDMKKYKHDIVVPPLPVWKTPYFEWHGWSSDTKTAREYCTIYLKGSKHKHYSYDYSTTTYLVGSCCGYNPDLVLDLLRYLKAGIEYCNSVAMKRFEMDEWYTENEVNLKAKLEKLPDVPRVISMYRKVVDELKQVWPDDGSVIEVDDVVYGYITFTEKKTISKNQVHTLHSVGIGENASEFFHHSVKERVNFWIDSYVTDLLNKFYLHHYAEREYGFIMTMLGLIDKFQKQVDAWK